MSDWRPVRLDWMASEVRETIDPIELGDDDVFHYSIPTFDELGDGAVEPASSVGSNKLLLKGGEVLVSKLNPRISRVFVAASHEIPTIASTEFIALETRDGIDVRFLSYWLEGERIRQFLDGSTQSVTRSHQRVRPDILTKIWLNLPNSTEQRRIADYLDDETARISSLINKKNQLLTLLEDRVDGYILQHIGKSALVSKGSTAVPLNRALVKMVRPASPDDEVITAYRDGQVTARSRRRAEGYTEAAEDTGQYQGVFLDDVVVHGLDGFAGAIGASEAIGKCSPVYHVCVPAHKGDPLYFARLLRVLAVSRYLQLFASSTRERAFDFRNWDLFGRIPIPDVSMEDQRAIGLEIRRIRPFRIAVERSAVLAQERRQALITAAVTGELQIPGIAA